MSTRIQCGDGVALVDYLYGEDDDRHAAMAAHVSTCTTCADEVRGLRATREQLEAWAPPELLVDRGRVPFSHAGSDGGPAAIEVARVERPMSWWRQPMPAWAQVAAAVVLFSTGVLLGTRATGVPADVASGRATVSAAPVSGGDVPVSTQDLAALEARLRAELTDRLAVSLRSGAAQPSSAAVLDQVRVLIQESERRQQRELTLRTAELVKDVDAQRRGDLARIERTFGQMEGTAGVQVEQQRQLLNYLMRVSQRQPQ